MNSTGSSSGENTTSMSGIVPKTAPHKIARFPNCRPSTASPTAAPSVICVTESIQVILAATARRTQSPRPAHSHGHQTSVVRDLGAICAGVLSAPAGSKTHCSGAKVCHSRIHFCDFASTPTRIGLSARLHSDFDGLQAGRLPLSLAAISAGVRLLPRNGSRLLPISGVLRPASAPTCRGDESFW